MINGRLKKFLKLYLSLCLLVCLFGWLISPASIMEFQTINSKQSLPESISLLLWQDEAAASCQLGGNKLVQWKTAVWFLSIMEHLHLAFRTTDGHFDGIGPRNKLNKKNVNSQIKQMKEHLYTKSLNYRDCVVSHGEQVKDFCLWCEALHWHGGKYQGWAEVHTDAHSLYSMFCCALLCWVTRQMTFFESSIQRSHTFASSKISSAECHLWVSLSSSFFLFLFFFCNSLWLCASLVSGLRQTASFVGHFLDIVGHPCAL